ncbi:MAG: gliding motility-associated C-terminal domain-containing protein [Bacteroidota bacterium]
MSKIYYILHFSFLSIIIYAQNPDIKRTWHWYFGNGAGLDFSSGTAVADTTGALYAKEGCASISDTAGNLLFYTDGDTIWDRRHLPMPNGTHLSSYLCSLENSSIQGVIILPNPADINQYYVITSDCFENFNTDGYRYSIVDMRLNGGYGDILPNKKRILLYSPSTEAITATRRTDYSWWIITHELESNKFIVYLLDSSGINFYRDISIGPFVDNNFSIGKIIISNNQEYLCTTFFIQNNTLCLYGCNEIFLFNKINCDITHYCFVPSFGGSFDACFSPQDKYIYFTNSGYLLFRFNLCQNDTIMIQQSLDTCYEGDDNSGMIGISISPINQLLISGDFHDHISVLDNPDSNIVNFNYMNFYLNGKLSRQQFPNINYFYSNNKHCKTTLLVNNLVNIYIPNIFTPNKDNINDFFSIQISGYQYIEYFIYNRWGNLIHSGKQEVNPEIRSELPLWNGYYNDNEVPTGVYFYLIKAYTAKGEEEIKKGFIHLLR